jgi:hypothetical protein
MSLAGCFSDCILRDYLTCLKLSLQHKKYISPAQCNFLRDCEFRSISVSKVSVAQSEESATLSVRPTARMRHAGRWRDFGPEPNGEGTAERLFLLLLLGLPRLRRLRWPKRRPELRFYSSCHPSSCLPRGLLLCRLFLHDHSKFTSPLPRSRWHLHVLGNEQQHQNEARKQRHAGKHFKHRCEFDPAPAVFPRGDFALLFDLFVNGLHFLLKG